MPISSKAFRIGDAIADVSAAPEGRGFSMYGRTREALRQAWADSQRAASHARSNPGVLRAAGVRIERMSAERLRMLAGHKQPWQTLAWSYRDMITELRMALKFRANSIAKAKFYVAEVDPDSVDDDPIPLSLRHDDDPEKARRVTLPEDLCAAAEEEHARLPFDDGSGFLGVWSENWDVAGECWLHGYTDPITQHEVWKIRSVDDVDVSGSTMTVKNELGQPRTINLDKEELYRLFIEHPRRTWLADSALNAMMDVLEDITLIGRELRAASRSRIAANGAWLIPDGMVRVKNTKDEDDNPETRSSRFIADLTAAMLAPISNEGEPGAVVPVILTGTRDDIETAKDSFLRFDREDSPTLLEKLSAALRRMATGLDVPPEVLTGMAEVNHWTAWQIDAATFKQFLEPTLRLMADSLTGAQLRAALLARGFPHEQVKRVRYWYNGDGITENPNRRQDALDARDRNTISDKAFREALGFGDADAPSPEEVMAMIAAKTGFDSTAAAGILRWAVEQAGGELPPLPDATAPAQLPAPRQQPPAAPPDATGTGGSGTPGTAPAQIAASAADLKPQIIAVPDSMLRYSDEVAHEALLASMNSYAEQAARRPAYSLAVDQPRQLMEIERALRDRILTEADTALTRARERAGNRFRSKATRDPSIAASLAAYSTWDWPRQVGREQCLALGADSGFLLAQAWEGLSGKFARWVLATIDRMLPIVLKMAGLDPRSTEGKARGQRMREEMAARVDTAWDGLQARLDALADRQLFDEGTTFDPEGEVPDLDVPPALVRSALAEIGGMPEEATGYDDRGRPVGDEPARGLSTGSTITTTLAEAGVHEVGYLWVYGITPLRNQFEPHAELEGTRFTSWRDPKLATPPEYAWVGPYFRTGDHIGCMCDFVPGYAIPDYAEQVRERLAVPTAGMQDILTLAESDDRAGRTGTVAQQTRDQWLDIQTLQTRFLEGELP